MFVCLFVVYKVSAGKHVSCTELHIVHSYTIVNSWHLKGNTKSQTVYYHIMLKNEGDFDYKTVETDESVKLPERRIHNICVTIVLPITCIFNRY